jgi:formate dehydrogenase assembly factor FdhD
MQRSAEMSSATTLGIKLPKTINHTLNAFARNERGSIYTAPQRIVAEGGDELNLCYAAG